MKRRTLIRELTKAKCYFKRHGKGGHDIYINIRNGRIAPVPRHTEIRETLCMLIRKQLGIEEEGILNEKNR